MGESVAGPSKSGSGQGKPGPGFSNRHALARRLRSATAAYALRRRIATVFAIVVAILLGYHAMFGTNGISAYGAKRAEDHLLARQIHELQTENGRLREHVEHLKSDPDAIEYEAHVRLRYTRPGQVIVLNNEKPASTTTPGAIPKQ